MTSLSFKTWLAPKLRDKSKPHTVRAERKRPIHAGDLLQLFTAMRTTSCQRIGEAQCKGTWKITIESSGMIRLPDDFINIRADAKGMPAWKYMLHDFAEDDGFADHAAFMDFFRPVLVDGPFTGDLIYWGDTLELDAPPVFMAPKALRVMRHMLYVDRVESGQRPRSEWGTGNSAVYSIYQIPPHIQDLEAAGYLRRDSSYRSGTFIQFRATINGMRATGLPSASITKALSL